VAVAAGVSSGEGFTRTIAVVGTAALLHGEVEGELDGEGWIKGRRRVGAAEVVVVVVVVVIVLVLVEACWCRRWCNGMWLKSRDGEVEKKTGGADAGTMQAGCGW